MLHKSPTKRLFTAVGRSDLTGVKLALADGAKVTGQESSTGMTPLMLAVNTKFNPEIVELLIKAGSDVNALDDRGFTALHFAVSSVNLATDIYPEIKVKSFLSLLRHINLNNSTYDNIVDHSVQQNLKMQIAVIKLLLEAKANPNISTLKSSYTPLVIAIKSSHIEIIKLLIANGADVNFENEAILAPIWFALNNIPNSIPYLIEAGADVNRKNRMNDTILSYIDDVELAKIVIASGADINNKNKFDITPLMLAAKNGRYDIVELLLQNGADISAYDVNGYTAFNHAVRSENMFIAYNIYIQELNLLPNIGHYVKSFTDFVGSLVEQRSDDVPQSITHYYKAKNNAKCPSKEQKTCPNTFLSLP